MTDIHAAEAAVARAAKAAGVEIRELADVAGFAEVRRLYDGIWGPDPRNPLVTTKLLRALSKSGGYVAGAYDGDELVGACVGFSGAPAGAELHSHIAGVCAAALGRRVGYALKLHQRAWVLARGGSAVEWTFDPLVARNAYFNVVKLAATAVEYLPDFYGEMDDEINAGDATDRLLIRWELRDPRVATACEGRHRAGDARAERAGGAVVGLGRTADGAPAPGTLDGDTVLVAVPPDIAALRSAAPDLARRWRTALREALVPLLAGGARVTGFDRAGWYIVGRNAG
ncbi:GNAT family N-acetyltransferase [Plantactinospora sp. BB1]|uniref:GNAT family N-acetyltransferase n=1 Tax=Plantactinospora sp. BB1 TaxID=2071627 RepID=UPI000D16D573|nr:GNAT family N-acetyltransferase [Plantactinospora sp. BB1]AVT38369.1 GNAT family N-acetyltransferase [Plantactinospora sp. BB1]